MKNSVSVFLLVVSIAIAALFLFQNCGKVSFSESLGTNVRGAAIICGLDGNTNACNSAQGMKGKIYVGNNTYIQLADYIQPQNALAYTLILPQAFIPTRWGTNGIASSAGILTNSSGQTLVSYFGFEVAGSFKLQPQEPEGSYEFALLSDDGSRLWIQVNNGTEELLIDNDGNHSTRLGCSTRAISLHANDVIHMRLQYYQGPQSELALNLLYRRLDAGTPAEVLCGTTDVTFYGFVENENQLSIDHQTLCQYTTNGQPSKYAQLCQDGWKPAATTQLSN